jgi:methyl-accepting chemotaxis protein
MLEGSKQVIVESGNLERVTEEITNSVNEMSLGMDEINKAVNEVNDISRENRVQIGNLLQEVSKFKLP